MKVTLLQTTHPNFYLFFVFIITAGPGGLAVDGLGQLPLACWECGFEYRRRHGCLLWVLCVVR